MLRRGKAMKFQSAGLVFVMYSVAVTASPAWNAATKPVHASVFVGDLDLHSPRALRLAQDRIHRAAVRLCNQERNSARADDREVTSDCVRNAESAAVEHLRD
jgi:UrcA family protein